MKPLNIKVGNQQFFAVEYWWEENDFIFITDKGEKCRCFNAYPASIKFDELDYSNTEELNNGK